jgi:hypothetical protein
VRPDQVFTDEVRDCREKVPPAADAERLHSIGLSEAGSDFQEHKAPIIPPTPNSAAHRLRLRPQEARLPKRNTGRRRRN